MTDRRRRTGEGRRATSGEGGAAGDADDGTAVVRRSVGARSYSSLRGRLVIAHLVVLAVALATTFLAVGLFAPPFFARHLSTMMGHGAMGGADGMAEMMRRMMGGGAQPGAPPGVGQLGTDQMAREFDAALAGAYRRSLAEALALAALAGGAVAVVLSVLISQRVAMPVRHLVTASRRIAAGHYAERVPVLAGDPEELADLAHSFNAMATALEATERRRLELIGDVAHELRTPMATIEGYLEGLLDGVVPATDHTWAKLHGEAGRLRRLVEDLQELSRAEARQLPLTLRPTDPTAVVEAAVDRLRGDFEAKGLSLQVDVTPKLPHVQADPDRGVQVLANLLTNALRYTPAPGQVHLRVSRSGTTVRFAVADTGIGLAAEDLTRVFERFYRGDQSRSRALGGTGIGLTIARALVEAMGGRIWAESDGPGRGATFSFELPLRES